MVQRIDYNDEQHYPLDVAALNNLQADEQEPIQHIDLHGHVPNQQVFLGQHSQEDVPQQNEQEQAMDDDEQQGALIANNDAVPPDELLRLMNEDERKEYFYGCMEQDIPEPQRKKSANKRKVHTWEAAPTSSFPHARRMFEIPDGVDIPGEDSSEGTKKSWRCMYRPFADFASRNNHEPIGPPFGLNLFSQDDFQAEGDPPKLSQILNMGKIRGFMQFLVAKEVNHVFLNRAKSFLNINIQCEYFSHLLRSGRNVDRCSVPPNPTVGAFPVVQQAAKVVRADRAKDVFKKQEDLHQHITFRPEPELLAEMVELTYLGDHSRFDLKKLDDMDQMSRMAFAAAFNQARQGAFRGEVCYKQLAIQHFLKRIVKLGPDPRGTPAMHIFVNAGKRNKDGHIEEKGFAWNPLPCLDPAATDGLYNLYRSFVAGFALPDVWEAGRWYAIPAFSAPSNITERIPPNTYANVFGSFLKVVGLDLLRKTTHICRLVPVWTMDDMAVATEKISRATNHHRNSKGADGGTEALKRSYMENSPAWMAVLLADGDHEKPELHSPPWTRAYTEVSLEMLASVPGAATFVERYKDVVYLIEERFAGKERIIFHFSLRTIRMHLECCILKFQLALCLLCSRPVDYNTRSIKFQEEPAFKRFASGPLFQFLRDPFFESPNFKRLHASVKGHEDATKNQNPFTGMSPEQLSFLEKINMGVPMNRMADAYIQMNAVIHGSRRFNQVTDGVGHNGPSERGEVTQPLALEPIPVRERPKKRHKDGKVRAARTSERERILAAIDQVVARQDKALLSLDKHCKTFQDFFLLWIFKLRPLEIEKGNKWRMDRRHVVNAQDGTKKEKVSKARAKWFSERKPIFMYAEIKMSEENATVTSVLEEGERVFDSLRNPNPKRKRRRPAMEKLTKGFLEAAGITRSSGRTPDNGPKWYSVHEWTEEEKMELRNWRRGADADADAVADVDMLQQAAGGALDDGDVEMLQDQIEDDGAGGVAGVDGQEAAVDGNAEDDMLT